MNNVTILITTTHALSLYMCTNFISFDIALSLGEEKDEYQYLHCTEKEIQVQIRAHITGKRQSED